VIRRRHVARIAHVEYADLLQLQAAPSECQM